MADTTLIRASWHSRFRTINRVIFFTLVVLLLSLSQAAANLRLETRVSVDSNEVTLADLVSGLSPAVMQEHALDRIIVAAAPNPGESRTLLVSTILRALRERGLELTALPASKRIRLTRTGTSISPSMIEREIKSHLIERGAPASIRVEIARNAPQLYVATDAPQSIDIVDLRYQRKRGRFLAKLRAPAGDVSAPVHEITGLVYETVMVPVLARAMHRGDIIGNSDINMIRLRASQSNRGVVTDKSELLGMAVQRYLSAGAVIRQNDIDPPLLVQKGELVIVHFSSPGLRLTTQTRALENGARGALIRVVNTQTNRILEANVTAPGRAEIINLAPAFGEARPIVAASR